MSMRLVSHALQRVEGMTPSSKFPEVPRPMRNDSPVEPPEVSRHGITNRPAAVLGQIRLGGFPGPISTFGHLRRVFEGE